MYYFKNGKLVKVIEVNGDYSVRFQTMIPDGRLHLIFFGVDEFFENIQEVTGLNLLMARGSGL